MFDLTLTFDNGPEPDVTPRVLDILAERGIKTTFFVIGEKLADPERRRLAARAHDEGHWIGNHTFTHSHPARSAARSPTRRRTKSAARKARSAISRIRSAGSGRSVAAAISMTRLLKPSVVDYLARNKHSCVLWNAIPRDWDDPDGWSRPRAASNAARSPGA